MIQLSFQPALDPYHAAFRILRLRNVICAARELATDHVRILDFYLCFPFEITRLRVKPKEQALKKVGAEYEQARPYGTQPDGKELLRRMEPVQLAAFQSLALDGFLDLERLEQSWVRPTTQACPDPIQKRIDELAVHDHRLLQLLQALATDYTLGGVGGLKERSGMLEHRYDPV